MNHILQQVWQQCLSYISEEISSPSDYTRWFAPIVPVSLEGKKLTLRLPSELHFDHIEKQYKDPFKRSLEKYIGKNFELEYEIFEGVAVPKYSAEKVDVQAISTSVKNSDNSQKSPFRTNLEPQLTFDSYVYGDSNLMVYNAAQAIIANPGSSLFNPLFIYGASGVGKTHILHAIGNAILNSYPEKRVVYVSAQMFKMQYVEASYRRKRPEDFIQFYQNMDILLLDDVQELRDAVSTQSAFFQIFNNLRALGRHIIMTSDRPAVDLDGLEERLYTRMKWGLTAEIERPDTELRKKILTRMMGQYNISLPQEVFDIIIASTSQNVRELEGVTKTLFAHHTMSHKPISMELTTKILKQYVKYEKKVITIQDIVEAVCSHFDIEPHLLQQKCRKRQIVLSRQIAMYLCKELTDSSFSVIGAEVGGQDHSTVIYACKSIENLLSTNAPNIGEDIAEIKSLLV